VESEPGKGSCFFFILPFTLHKEVEDKLILERIPLSVAEHKLKGKILLVEDEAINQLVTKRQLELWGLQVEIAQQGEEAIDMHRRNPYDLIMMDIQLPVMDGVTATKKIRAMEQTGLRKTPIVAFTAAALLGDRERFMEQGMDDYIAKPVDMNELYNILAKLLEQ
jgi:CheY-like chemotaxis protein